MEIWKEVKGYENCYEVSNHGRVRSKDHIVPCKGGTRLVKGKIKKLFANKSGYLITTLSKENRLATFTVHQLVAVAFLFGFTKGTEVNHRDGDPANNHVGNLEISNASHNQLHAVRTGLKKVQRVSQYHHVSYLKSSRAKAKWAVCIRHAGKSCFGWKTFMTEEEAARYADALLDSIGDFQRLRNFPLIP